MAALEQVQVTHPDNPLISGVNRVMLHTGDRVPGRQDRNTVLLSNGKLVPGEPST